MLGCFITAYISYFVVIDPLGKAPIFLALTEERDRARKFRTALDSAAVATAIILAGLSVQYVIDGLAAIGFVTPLFG